MTWFETLTGLREESPDHVRKQLTVEGDRLRSSVNGSEWRCGKLATPHLSELRERARRILPTGRRTAIREIVADVQDLHCDVSNTGAMFQVASQFNLLEMTSPSVAPEDGVGIYERDFTQGPACAIAAGAGTIYRNYFASVNGQVGQTEGNQVDCLGDVGCRLGNTDQRFWKMQNGYALPSHSGLEAISSSLSQMNEAERDHIRSSLRIGLHSNTQVTLTEAVHVVSQAYCSAMPVSYTRLSSTLWARFAILILEAAYEATICAAIENAASTGNNRLYLTLLGGGAFGNELQWILDSIFRAIDLYSDCGLDVAIVSYGRSNRAVKQIVDKLDSLIRERMTS